MTNVDPVAALAEAVVAAHDPLERFSSAVVAAWNRSPLRAGGGEVARVRVEERPDGTALRLTDVAANRTVEVVLDIDAARKLGCRLSAAGARQAGSAQRRRSAG